MQWMNPLGAWALASLAVIIGLYILKQRMEPMVVSSTDLWRKALASMEADRPFQKLRRNLLLFLQLLLALLLALSIMRPMTLGGITGELVYVFDLSASMQSGDGEGSRIDIALTDARRRLDGLPEGTRVSILTAGSTVAQPVSRSGDLLAVRRALDQIEAGNGGADLDGAMSLALAMQRELESVQLIVYTDQTLADGPYMQPSLAPGLSNRALISLNATDTAAVAQVKNYGGAAQVTAQCHADGTLVDIRTVDIGEGETVSVQFDLTQPAERVTATIAEPDALAADNIRYWARRETGATTVVLAGRDNVFAEKALALRSDVTLLKTTAAEAALVADRALTVLDGPLPEMLPESGALLLIDPDTYVGEVVKSPASLSAAANALADSLNQYLTVEEIQVASYRPVQGGTPVWLANGVPVLSIFEMDGRRVAVIGFDLHNANLPLLKEFPLFMQQLLDHLVPEPLGAGLLEAACGDALEITPQSFARRAAVVLPSGERVSLPLATSVLERTGEIGVYLLEQENEQGEIFEIPFSLHIPHAESDVSGRPQGVATDDIAVGALYGREWTPWLIAALLLVMLLEWWVYRRGY